ncbi:MAG TPA: four helix bundle protein [Chloroflexia bacterium]|nr:four helix bundle protein [Chloroflexia bacterium]
MGTIKRFEDMEVWKNARELSKAIYAVTSRREFAFDAALRDQMRRAAVSIVSNIAEGFERGSDKELKQFLIISKGSAGEIRAQLYVALDASYLPTDEFEELRKRTTDLSRMLAGFIRYLNQSNNEGSRLRELPSDYQTNES